MIVKENLHQSSQQKLHHRSNAYQRKSEIIKGKNILALEMLERALDNGIDADYLLVDSWYAKPNFIKEANTLECL